MNGVGRMLSLLLGFALGAIREILVVKYSGSIIDLKPVTGSLTSLGIGHLDFLVFMTLASFQNPWMFYGYIYGESVASYFAIKRRKICLIAAQ